MKTITDITEAVLKIMPEKFTTNFFLSECRKMGMKEEDIYSQRHKLFLRDKCRQEKGKATWIKIKTGIVEQKALFDHPNAILRANNTLPSNGNGSVSSLSTFLQQFPIETILNFVKEQGYIVLKP